VKNVLICSLKNKTQKIITMKNEILKYLGILVILVGVALLAVYQFGSFTENSLLVAGGLCVVTGAVGFVILNKYFE